MTGDDLLLDASEVALFVGTRGSSPGPVVVVEEKIDGANLGISLATDRFDAEGRPAFRFQKRAHYISSASEPQYKGLDAWAHTNRRALRRMLRCPLRCGAPRAAPGQRILFGEWCARVHSKVYSRLPSKFVVFDLFDSALRRGRGGFVAVAVRDALLRAVRGADGFGSRLFRIRTIARRRFARVSDVVALLCEGDAALSAYTGGSDGALGRDGSCRSEGLYLRVDGDDGVLRARCKLVHGDFHASVAAGRWERRVEHNAVRPDLWSGRDDNGVIESN
jgi:atypical dual specificity phosphatase